MIPSINKGWLAPDFLDWYKYSEGGSISKITSEMYSVPHAYVNHASELLIPPSSELCRAVIPHGMTEVLISEGKYAKFTHKGHLVDSGDTARKIWNVWMPESGLKILDGLSIEVYGPKFDRDSANSEFDILVPIQD